MDDFSPWLFGLLLAGSTLAGVLAKLSKRLFRFGDEVPFATIFGTFLAVLAGITALLLPFLKREPKGSQVEHLDSPSASVAAALRDYRATVSNLMMRAEWLQLQVQQMATSSPSSTVKLDARFLVLEQRLDKDSKGLEELRALFLSDGERAVTLPLLKRDVQGLTAEVASVKDNLVGLRAMMTEATNQNRWVIGTLGVGMLALVIPAVRSMLPGAKKEEEEKKHVGKK